MVVNLQRCWTEFTVFEADEEDKQILLKFKTISRLSRTENQRKTATIILYTKKQNKRITISRSSLASTSQYILNMV